MPRGNREAAGGVVYHVLNRANSRAQIFLEPKDYQAFENVLEEARDRAAMRLLSYCIMPNHWHLVVWPRDDGDLPRFMRWLTMTHTQRWHAAHGTAGTGHVYQGRYKSFPMECGRHFLIVCRYVERNPLRAKLIHRAQQWRYGSLWRRENGDPAILRILDEWPTSRPDDWMELVNRAENPVTLERVRNSVARGWAFGSLKWCRTLRGK